MNSYGVRDTNYVTSRFLCILGFLCTFIVYFGLLFLSDIMGIYVSDIIKLLLRTVAGILINLVSIIFSINSMREKEDVPIWKNIVIIVIDIAYIFVGRLLLEKAILSVFTLVNEKFYNFYNGGVKLRS